MSGQGREAWQLPIINFVDFESLADRPVGFSLVSPLMRQEVLSELIFLGHALLRDRFKEHLIIQVWTGCYSWGKASVNVQHRVEMEMEMEMRKQHRISNSKSSNPRAQLMQH